MKCAGQGHCNAKATTTPYDAVVQIGKRHSLWADVASGQDTPQGRSGLQLSPSQPSRSSQQRTFQMTVHGGPDHLFLNY